MALCDVVRFALFGAHGDAPTRAIPYDLLPLVSFGALSGHLSEIARLRVQRTYEESPAVHRVCESTFVLANEVGEAPVAGVLAPPRFLVVHGRAVALRAGERVLQPPLLSDDAGIVPPAVLEHSKLPRSHAGRQTRRALALHFLLVENLSLRASVEVRLPVLITKEKRPSVVSVLVEYFPLVTHAGPWESRVTDAAAEGLVVAVAEVAASTHRGKCLAVDTVHQRFAIGAKVLVGSVRADGVQGRHADLLSIGQP